MKKVVYSVSRYSRGEINKLTGLGFLTDTDLVIACVSKQGKPYIRVFEGCVKDCHPVPGKDGEHKGMIYEIREVEMVSDDGKRDTREIELEYSIWYKFVD